MIDNAAVVMAQGVVIAAERKEGCDDNMTSSHFHSFFELYYLEEGGRLHVINDSLYEIGPHSLVVLPPHLLHHSYGRKGMPFRRVVVYFTKEGPAPGLFERLTALEGVHELTDSADIAFIEDALHHLLSEEDSQDDLTFTVQRSLLNLLIVRLLRLKLKPVVPVNVGKIRRIVRYLSDHYAEDISLDELAQMFFISKFHLCREFKKYTRNTVIEYRNFVRILHAQRLFMESDKNLSEVAEEVGFSSLTHFERVFVKVVGMLPNESRRRIIKSKSEGLSHNSSLPVLPAERSESSSTSRVLQASSVKLPKFQEDGAPQD